MSARQSAAVVQRYGDDLAADVLTALNGGIRGMDPGGVKLRGQQIRSVAVSLRLPSAGQPGLVAEIEVAAQSTMDNYRRDIRDGDSALVVVLRVVEAVAEVLASLRNEAAAESITRSSTVSVDVAAAAAGSLEVATAALVRADLDDERIDPDDVAFLHSTITSIQLWRERDGADPRIFELLVVDLTRRMLRYLAPTEELIRHLADVGIDEDSAKVAVEAMVTNLHMQADRDMGPGQEDPAADANVVTAIAANTDRMATALEGFVASQPTRRDRLTEAAATGGAEAVTGMVLGTVAGLVQDNMSRAWIGLQMAWHAVRSLFFR